MCRVRSHHSSHATMPAAWLHVFVRLQATSAGTEVQRQAHAAKPYDDRGRRSTTYRYIYLYNMYLPTHSKHTDIIYIIAKRGT